MSDFQVSLAIEIHLQVVFLLFRSSFSIQSDFIIIGKYLIRDLKIGGLRL